MIIHDAAIPTKFQRLDTNINDADAPANVRDLQMLRKNHNKLLADRIRSTICSMRFNDSSYNGYYTAIGPFGLNGRLYNGMRVLVNIPFVPKAECVNVRLNIRGYHSGTVGADDVKLYPVVRERDVNPVIDESLAITINTNTAWTLFSVDIPTLAASSGRLHYLTVMVVGGMTGGDVKGADMNVIGSGSLYVEVDDATATNYDGNFVYCTSDATVEPRMVIRSLNFANSGTPNLYRYIVNKPWANPPVPGTDTINFRANKACKIQSLTAYELVVSDSDFGYSGITGAAVV